jgi:hypothetical protein
MENRDRKILLVELASWNGFWSLTQRQSFNDLIRRLGDCQQDSVYCIQNPNYAILLMQSLLGSAASSIRGGRRGLARRRCLLQRGEVKPFLAMQAQAVIVRLGLEAMDEWDRDPGEFDGFQHPAESGLRAAMAALIRVYFHRPIGRQPLRDRANCDGT